MTKEQIIQKIFFAKENIKKYKEDIFKTRKKYLYLSIVLPIIASGMLLVEEKFFPIKLFASFASNGMLYGFQLMFLISIITCEAIRFLDVISLQKRIKKQENTIEKCYDEMNIIRNNDIEKEVELNGEIQQIFK